MKTLLFLISALFLAGCSTGMSNKGVSIQQALDATLPPDFKGDGHVHHKNVYFSFTIDAGGLARGPQGWSWSWLTYTREGFVSNGEVSFGRRP